MRLIDRRRTGTDGKRINVAGDFDERHGTDRRTDGRTDGRQATNRRPLRCARRREHLNRREIKGEQSEGKDKRMEARNGSTAKASDEQTGSVAQRGGGRVGMRKDGANERQDDFRCTREASVAGDRRPGRGGTARRSYSTRQRYVAGWKRRRCRIFGKSDGR